MAITGTALFGSRARGDYTENSDTDVLVWTDEPFPRHRRLGRVSLAFYPECDLLEKAARGDLFASHIVHEAVPLRDPKGKLDDLRTAYAPPLSYEPQIRAASDLAWFLIDHHSVLRASLLNARSAWCARTIAIGRSAERGLIAFSPGQLARGIQAARLPELISIKDTVGRMEGLDQLLECFVREYGADRNFATVRPTIGQYKKFFEATANSFALKTIRQAGLKGLGGQYF